MFTQWTWYKNKSYENSKFLKFLSKRLQGNFYFLNQLTNCLYSSCLEFLGIGVGDLCMK